MTDELTMKSTLLRRSEMKCERCGAKIASNDSELCKTDPNGKFKEDNLHIYCAKCTQRYWQNLREASSPSNG